MKVGTIVMGGVFRTLDDGHPRGSERGKCLWSRANSGGELSNLGCCVLRTPPYGMPRPTVSPTPSMVVLVGSSKFALR